jgi:hypothetical protein
VDVAVDVAVDAVNTTIESSYNIEYENNTITDLTILCFTEAQRYQIQSNQIGDTGQDR